MMRHASAVEPTNGAKEAAYTKYVEADGFTGPRIAPIAAIAQMTAKSARPASQ